MQLHISLLVLIILLYVFANISNKYNEKSRRKLFLIPIFLLFFIATGLRAFEVGNDTSTYLLFFDKAVSLKWDIIGSNYFEKGYVIYNILISYITQNHRMFIIITSFIFSICTIKFIYNYSKNPFLSLLIYIGLLFFYYSMTMLRQFFAMVIILYAFKFVQNRNLLKYILSVIFASLFHSSAVIAIFIYPLYECKVNKRTLALIFTASIGGIIFIPKVINIILGFLGRGNFYTNKIGSNDIANVLYTLVYLLMFFILYVLVGKNNKNKTKTEIDFYLLMLLVSSAINGIAINMNVLSRLAMYYTIFTIVGIPNMLFEIKSLKTRQVFYLFFIIFLILYSSVILELRPEWLGIDSYKMDFSLLNR